MTAAAVAALLVDPSRASELDRAAWTGILCAAQAERLLASLAYRLEGLDLPDDVASVLVSAKADAAGGRTEALWEAEMARRALAALDVPVVLLKGTAFVAAGLDAGQGRLIGDLDILVPRDRLGEVEAALLSTGWEWVKPDPYDDQYYRRWMHELPPLIHRERDRMIDVPSHDPAAHGATNAQRDSADRSQHSTRNGLRVLSPEDMIVHAAAHLLADGDLAGGLRNLWDVDRLVREYSGEGFGERLRERARLHGLLREVERCLQLSYALFETPVTLARPWQGSDDLFRARLLARDGWGRPTCSLLRLTFYVRSHWLRMPPLMLARHLWTKWRKG